MSYGIGLSALTAASEAIDATSNNIANAQTVGYKAGQYVFQDEFFRATDPQNPNRTGMGTAVTQIRRPQTNGTVVATSNPLDLAIGGIGMFTTATTVVDGTSTGNPSNFQYTRNGQFGVDSSNRIVNENGNYLVGFPANPDGTINTAVQSVMTLSQAPLPGIQTSKSTLALNLDDTTNPVTSTFDPNTAGTYSQSTSQTVYDSTGLSHTLSMYYVKQPSINLTMTPSNQVVSGSNAMVSLSYNTQQKTVGPDGLTTDATTIATTSTPSTAQGGTTQETLSNATVTGLTGSNYLLTLQDGTTLTVQGLGAVQPTSYTMTAAQLNTAGVTPLPTIGVPTTVSLSNGTSVQLSTSDGTSYSISGLDNNGGQIYANSAVSGSLFSGAYQLNLANGKALAATAVGNQAPTSYTSPTSRYAMYATIDGVPVEGNPSGALNGFPPGVNTITSLGTMAFIGGKNIDSLARDAYNVPQFSTQVKITAPVGGSTNPSSVAFTIDSTNSTAYSAVAQTYTNSQDGSPLSQLSSYSFDSTGKLVAQYTNGKSKIQGQVALATFGNNEGLIPIGGNSFEASALSGSATTGTAGSGIFGALKSQALEQSNVDLTGQLVTLMALQRQYSAASQVVKTSQTIEDEILNKLG